MKPSLAAWASGWFWASTNLRQSPFTETTIEGVHSVVYKPGVQPVALTEDPDRGTFDRGLHRISGFVFSYDGLSAKTLLGIIAEIDLIVRYRAPGEARKLTLSDVVFAGDAIVSFPPINRGVSTLIGVPFLVNVPEGDTLDDHLADAVES